MPKVVQVSGVGCLLPSRGRARVFSQLRWRTWEPTKLVYILDCLLEPVSNAQKSHRQSTRVWMKLSQVVQKKLGTSKGIQESQC